MQRTIRPAVIAAVLLATSGSFTPSLAKPVLRLASAPVTEGMLSGCWARQKSVPDDGNYWSLCFRDYGKVESVVISGPPGGALSGSASEGSFELSDGKIKFSFEPGDYGWLWESGSVSCDANLIGDKHIDFTACNSGEPDMRFEREIPAAQ